MSRKRLLQGLAFASLSLSALLFMATLSNLQAIPDSLVALTQGDKQPQLLDRNANVLNISYQHAWNLTEIRPLYAIPIQLQQAFIEAEDRRFASHHGVDWQARLHAVWQNLKAGKKVRGASTISEQVIRLLHPRPRTLFSRWLEGFEASRLEQRFSKAEILEFYLNQVPYARQWRGVAQAARGYFGRDLETLNLREMLALATLVRAPGRMDLFSHPERLEQPLIRLAVQMQAQGLISTDAFEQLQSDVSPWDLQASELAFVAPRFIEQVQAQWKAAASQSQSSRARLSTTLDGVLNSHVQAILEQRLQALAQRNVHHAAALVVDHQSGEVLAWANAVGSDIDAVTPPRQPGSTLKPLLYALAMEKGWHAATIILDSPLSHAIGSGLHNYHNYSRNHYGPLRLRDALGNSLNIPAIRAIQFTGVTDFLYRLHQLGFTSLKENAEFYGEGLALGNGEVTLFELVQAYATLANQGQWQALRLSPEIITTTPPRQIFHADITSIISDILSDSQARALEFGSSSLLSFPLQTAIKTGTSTNYRDAWAIGYSHRYVVGIWMGNLDRELMQEVTGSTGPALAVRSVFAELARHGESRPLYFSPRLQPVKVCQATGHIATAQCPSLVEWFRPEQLPEASQSVDDNEGATQSAALTPPYLSMPTPGLQMALDPRIPDQLEAFPMQVVAAQTIQKIDWQVDGKLVATTGPEERRYLWPLVKGAHTVRAKIWSDGRSQQTQNIGFSVK